MSYSSVGIIKILHIITGLSTGGAEMMLFKLLKGMDKKKFENIVISLSDRGSLSEEIEALGVPVITLEMKYGFQGIKALWRLISSVQRFSPDVVQGWMSHANFASQLSVMLRHSHTPVIWNIRQSLYSLEYEKKKTTAIIKVCGLLSHLPAAIIYNSSISAEQHEVHGYNKSKRRIIPNGFDTDIFRPDLESTYSVRRELNIPDDFIIIGLIGRYHPMKDHTTFFKAAALLLNKYSKINFILAGDCVDTNNESLLNEIAGLGLLPKVHLLGERHDLPRLNAAMDIACTSSYTESFPNVIGEAMSCGIPCVATDVGDSGRVIGDTGRVISPRNPQAFAEALVELVELGNIGRKSLGQAARQRIKDNFSSSFVVHQYESLYENIIQGTNGLHSSPASN